MTSPSYELNTEELEDMLLPETSDLSDLPDDLGSDHGEIDPEIELTADD